jgi:uncharacterized membrane protein
MKQDSHVRSIIKTITWRIIGVAFSSVVAYIITGSPQTCFFVGCIDVVFKGILYYIHERIWQKIDF